MCCCDFLPDEGEEQDWTNSSFELDGNELKNEKQREDAFERGNIRIATLSYCNRGQKEDASNSSRKVLSLNEMRLCILYSVFQRVAILFSYGALPSTIAFCVLHFLHGNKLLHHIQHIHNCALARIRGVLIHCNMFPTKVIEKKL